MLGATENSHLNKRQKTKQNKKTMGDLILYSTLALTKLFLKGSGDIR